MYNLNVTGPGAGGSSMLSLQLPQGENSTTPRTPEILNSLIAMSNPFESSYRAHGPRLASSPPGGSDTSTSSSGSPGCMSPPSVQHTCSQLIKEGLKLTIQSKRRQSQQSGGLQEDPNKVPRQDEVSCDGLGDDDDDDPFSPRDGLTPEDEERRRRRRERNKIAATKCRLKKRERTVNLVQESEILENQNLDLKSQIQELETQRRRLVDMLSVHRPSCTKSLQSFPTSDAFPMTNYQTFPRSPAMSLESNTSVFRRMNMNSFPRSSTSVVDTMTYRRVEMSSATCVDPYQRMETVLEESSYCRPQPETTVYHNFESQEVKDNALLVPYCRSNINSVESPPSFTRIGDQYSCQNLTNLDQFVKPELPSMTNFHNTASSYGRQSNLDLTNSISPSYESVSSPSLNSTPYQQFDEESETFSNEFSPTGLDRSCITGT